MDKRAVVLAGDYNYLNYIETTIKSLCMHNTHLKIYLFNQDIPQEWFLDTSEKIARSGSELIDVKCFEEYLSEKLESSTYEHINYMTFARMYIPKYVEESVVIYLDSDIIITGDITHLYDLDLSNAYVAAVKDMYGIVYTKQFNAGFLVINNKKWKEDDVLTAFCKYIDQNFDKMRGGDQDVLFDVLKEKVIYLSNKYNFQVGADYCTIGDDMMTNDMLFDDDSLPLVVHYLTGDKPWNTFSQSRLRELWWQYRQLEWAVIHQNYPNVNYTPRKPFKLHTLTVTNNVDLEQFEFLIKQLPNVCFHIAFYIPVSSEMMRLMAYPNVRVYSQAIYATTIRALLNKMTVYLDINHGDKAMFIIEEIEQSKKMILSFKNTANPKYNTFIVDDNQPEKMVNLLKQIDQLL